MRQNVYAYPTEPEDGEQPTLAGWFDTDRAELVAEDTAWDGMNRVSKATGVRWEHEELWRTAGARYVVHHWSAWQGRPQTWVYVGDEDARDWLLRNNRDEHAARWFGPMEDERAPGRPPVGAPVLVRLPDDLLARVDEYAQQRDITRAAAVRDLLGAALGVGVL